jgi:hypothetical protein
MSSESDAPNDFKELLGNLALIDTIKQNLSKHNQNLELYYEDIATMLTEQRLTRQEQIVRINDYFYTMPNRSRAARGEPEQDQDD